MKKLLAFLVLGTAQLSASTNVSGKLAQPSGSGAYPGYVQFDLENCGGNYPIVSGVSITPQQQFKLASDGTWSGTLDRSDEIACNGDTTSNWWHVTYFVNFRQVGPARDVRLTSLNCASSCSVDGITPLTVFPTVPAPTGDNTYLRLDGGNQPNPYSFINDLSVGGSLSAKRIAQVRVATNFSGTDIRAQAMAAYADCPTGAICPIFIPPTSDGSCRTFTGQFAFATLNKPADLYGFMSCIQASDTSGTSILMDWGSGLSLWLGGMHGIDLRGPCATSACSGVTTKGLQLASSNGAVMVDISGNRIGLDTAGFLTGLELQGSGVPNAGAWMSLVSGNEFVGNNVDIVDTNLSEGPHVMNNMFARSVVGFDVPASGTDAFLTGNHFDDITTCAIRMSGTSTVKNYAPHFENGGLGAPNYYCITNTSSRYIEREADIRTNITSGSTTSFGEIDSQFIDIENPLIYSAGQSLTQSYSFNNNSSTVKLYPINISYPLIPLDFNASFTGRRDYCPLNGIVAQLPCIRTFYAPQFDTFTSNTANPATSGFLRLAKTDNLNFRNNANSANVNGVSFNGSDQVSLGGSAGAVFSGPVSGISTLGVSGQITSTQTTGTSPLNVSSTTENTNLNSQLWHSRQSIEFTGTIDFASISAQTCAENTITATSAVTGNRVFPAWPSTLENGLSGLMYVSAADTVKVRLCNVTAGAIDPASQTFAGSVVK